MLFFLVYAAIGKLLIFLWQQFPLSAYLGSKWKPLQKLFGCDLCFGVWVYWVLALFFPTANIFICYVDQWLSSVFLSTLMYVFTALLTGAVTSFIVHLFSLGWNMKFQRIVIDG